MHEGFLLEWCRLTFVIPSGFFPDRSANFIFVFFVQPLSKTIIIIVISPYFFLSSFLLYITAGDGPPGYHSCCGSVGGSDGPPVQLGFDCRRSCPLSQRRVKSRNGGSTSSPCSPELIWRCTLLILWWEIGRVIDCFLFSSFFSDRTS